MSDSYAVQFLRQEETALKSAINAQIEVINETQLAHAKATAADTAAKKEFDRLNDALLAVQEGIEDLDAAEQAREAANAPDQPTNIPDHAVPWTPIESAVGEE